MPYRYVPLLRTKTGETNALHNLSAAAKGRAFPVFHLVARPPAGFAAALSAAWPQGSVALDGTFSFGLTNSTNAFTSMMTALGNAHLAVIPSIEVGAAQQYTAAIQKFVGRYAPGVVVKATLRLLPQVMAWVAAKNWQPNDVDLVIDAGHVAGYESGQFQGFVRQVISQSIPAAARWRSITLASAAAPQDHSALAHGRNDVPRHDWQLWNAIAPQVQFALDYGDYCTLHPDLTEPPGVAMTRATVSVRYAIADDWIVLKGRATGGVHGQPMGQQYHHHARTLVADPNFGGVANCWADQRIRHIAGLATTTGAGNRSTWAAIGINRHISLVADRLP